MAQNIYNYFFEYDLSKTPGFIYVLANFLGVIIYTSFNPRRRKDVWSYAELIILELMYLIYNFLTRDISTVLFIPSIMGAFIMPCALMHLENLQELWDGSWCLMYLKTVEFPILYPSSV